MKVCKLCQQEKPLDAFYECKTVKCGRESRCKACRLLGKRVLDPKPGGRKKIAAKKCGSCKETQNRSAFYETTSGISWLCRVCTVQRRKAGDIYKDALLAAKKYRESSVGKEKRKAFLANVGNKYREKDKAAGKIKARYLARYHLDPKPCEKCGEVAQAHHHDYSKPLEVSWLCAKHHGEEHRKYG